MNVWFFVLFSIVCAASAETAHQRGQSTVVTNRPLGESEIQLWRQLGINITRHYTSVRLARTVLSVTGFAQIQQPTSVLGSIALVESDLLVRKEWESSSGDNKFTPPGTTVATSSWALDRIDQRSRTLDNVYNSDFQGTGSASTVFVVDTGVQVDHSEFEGRARSGWTAFGSEFDDCNGHGTHVAGLAGGKKWGVAKTTNIVSVRVLDCSGSGTVSGVVQGLMWVYDNAVARSVVNLSLGLSSDVSSFQQILDDLVSIGVLVVAAAGNSGSTACDHYPSSYSSAISVSASNALDQRASFANYDTDKNQDCVQLFAPGRDVRSAWLDNKERTISGTSMSSPLVAGALALLRESGLSASTARVCLLKTASVGYLSDVGYSSNLLLFVGNTNTSLSDPSPSQTPSPSNPGESAASTKPFAFLFAIVLSALVH